MTFMRSLTIVFASLLALSEAARWYGDPRFVPLAFDEILVSAALIWSALVAPRTKGVSLVLGWGVLCGLAISLLVPTLDHLLFGPAKESAGTYSVILGIMLLIGLAALFRSLALVRQLSPGP